MLLCKKYCLLFIAIEYFIISVDTGGIKYRSIRDMDMPEKLSFDSQICTWDYDIVVTTYLTLIR